MANVDEGYWVVLGFPADRVGGDRIGRLRRGERLRLTWESQYSGLTSRNVSRIDWVSSGPSVARVTADAPTSAVLVAEGPGDIGPLTVWPFYGPLFASAFFFDGSCITEPVRACTWIETASGRVPGNCQELARIVVE